MTHKAWCSIEEVSYYFSRSSIKFQGHTGWKINDLDQIWARLLGRSQLSNPSDLPCLMQLGHYCIFRKFELGICLYRNVTGIMQGVFGGIIYLSIPIYCVLIVNKQWKSEAVTVFKITTWPDHDRLTTVSWRTTTVCQRALTARQTPAGVPQPALTVRGTSQERVRMCQGGWPTCYNRLRNVKPAVNMSRRHRAASNPMTTGRNPRTTGLKSKHFSRPPCRGCKTPWPVRATITVAKRRTGTFVRRTKKPSLIFASTQTSPGGRSRSFTPRDGYSRSW